MNDTMPSERLRRQIEFIIEADKIKHVLRRNYVTNGSRTENVAEHTWHLTLMAVTLAEHACADARDSAIDLLRVLRMLLIHDLVEIDAGDTFAYDAPAHADKFERENRAADRIFGLLPADQAADYKALWIEFEERVTAEAKFANALDRLAPIILNLTSGGRVYQEGNISPERILERNGRQIEEGAPGLIAFVHQLIEEAKVRGVFDGIAANAAAATTKAIS